MVTEAPGTPGIDVVTPEAPEVVAVPLGTVAVAPFAPGTVAVVPFTPGTVAVVPFTPGIAVVVSLTPGMVAVVVAVPGTEVVEVVLPGTEGTVVGFNPSSAFSPSFRNVCPSASDDAATQLSAAIVTAVIGFMARLHVCQMTCNKASRFITCGH